MDGEGERIRIACRVLDGDGAAVDDAMIELWQGDTGGFGRLATDAEGRCVFETVKTTHIDVSVFARGLIDRVATRIYFAEDAVPAWVPEERRGTLLARPDEARPGVWNFEIRLQGEGETVFFEDSGCD
ncbi:MAG: hypothetical protein ACRD96_21080 [Bryobacteraceae bacterium]